MWLIPCARLPVLAQVRDVYWTTHHNASADLVRVAYFGVQVRDVYWTARNFRNRVADFLRYRRVTANMDQRFADATPEDLARCDGARGKTLE
jgi:hypothetical protein